MRGQKTDKTRQTDEDSRSFSKSAQFNESTWMLKQVQVYLIPLQCSSADCLKHSRVTMKELCFQSLTYFFQTKKNEVKSFFP